MVIFSNDENFIPNNNYKMPMTNGEISPVLGSYVEPIFVEGIPQMAYAYVGY